MPFYLYETCIGIGISEILLEIYFSLNIFRYFAHDCAKYFKTDDNGQPIRIGAPRSLSEKVCQERYSRIVPSTQGTVIYRVLPPNINIHSENFQPYSKPVQDLLKTTNIRVVMTAMHTLGDENLNLTEHKV